MFSEGGKIVMVAFPLANMSAHNCSENPFISVLNKKPMNMLPGIKMSARRRVEAAGTMRGQRKCLGSPHHSQA